MSQLHDILVSRYADHFERVNQQLDANDLSHQQIRAMDLMYGPLLTALTPGSKILDLGCGVGFLLKWLSTKGSIVPIGVDASPTQVAIAERQLPEVEVHLQDGLEFLRAHPGEFQGIFCTDVLEHIPTEDLLLEWVSAANNALTSGGFFYCRTPNAANLAATYSRYMDLTHYRIFTSTSIFQLLEAGGLSNYRIVPVQTGHFLGHIRLRVEALVHRMIFRICGRALERVFTSNICAVGYKVESDSRG